MGRAGSALDNAVIEFWHSRLEFELRRLEQFATKAQARTAVAAWIEDYHGDRRHSTLGMASPTAYERALRPRRCRPGAGSMTSLLPCRRQPGPVLAEVKATPSRAADNLTPAAGEADSQRTGAGRTTKIRQFQVSMVRGDCR
jgi:hypothetical protein